MSENKEIEISMELREPMELGDVFAQSGMFPDIKTKAQGAVKILAGRELGLSPFESMKNIYLINGRLAIQSNAMASLVKRSKRYDYKVNKIDDTECSITFYEIKGDQKEEIGTSVYTFKDAAKASLVNKPNWQNFPRNMMFARALSNGVRFYCPDAVCGWHTVEEMEEVYSIDNKKTVTLTENGEVVSGEKIVSE